MRSYVPRGLLVLTVPFPPLASRLITDGPLSAAEPMVLPRLLAQPTMRQVEGVPMGQLAPVATPPHLTAPHHDGDINHWDPWING